jgi:hypothetical protein
MRTRQKWVGIIVVLAVLLFASAGVGQARGGGHGFGGHGFHQGFHQGFHHFGGVRRFGGPRIGIGISPFLGPCWEPYAYPYACPPGVVAPPPVYAPPFG